MVVVMMTMMMIVVVVYKTHNKRLSYMIIIIIMIHSLRKDSSSSVDNENNLTDSTKVRLLHQLVDMQSQPVTERRKFSDSRRYWSDSSGLDNTLEVNQLCRTSSSPGVLGSCCCKSYGGGEGSGNKEVGSGNKRKGRSKGNTT